MGIGGGIITRKLLFTVFLIASLSLGGISTANAAEQGTVQTQTSNTDTVKNTVNTQNDNINILYETAHKQKSAENSVKTVKNTVNEKSTKPNKVKKTNNGQTVSTQNKNKDKPVTTVKQTTESNAKTETTSTENTIQITIDSSKNAETVNNSSLGGSTTTQETSQTASTSTENTTKPIKDDLTDTKQFTNSTNPVSQATTDTQATVVAPTNASADTEPVTTSTETTPVAQTTVNQSTNNAQEELQAAAGNTYTDVHAIWLSAEDISSVSVSQLVNADITDIFVKSNMVSTPTYQTVLSSAISKFQNTGIRIHAWITCFKDANGNWVDPANATQRQNLLNMITNVAKNYNIDGIHLDYVRYSGVGENAAYKYPNSTGTITSFVKDVWNRVKAINPDIAVSAAVMPEGANNAYYYGQDYKSIAQYTDFIVPMIYKGNYDKDTTWISTVTKYIVGQVGDKPVIAGLQSYVSDNNTTPLSASELKTDIQSAINNGSSGYALFKYGMVSQDFLNPPSFTISQIKDAASRVKTFIETNHALPNYVTIGTNQISMPDFLKLMVKSVLQINSGTTSPITLKDINDPNGSTGSFTSGNIYKTEYLDMAKRINAFLDSNGLAPNYSTNHLGKISYESLVYMYSKILNYYKVNSKLPSYVSMNSAMKISVPIASGSATGTTTTSGTVSTVTSVPADLKKYLAATANCQVTNASIKALAASITKGKTTTYAKAVAIFNWVRDNLSYSFYYNTKYGAVGALNAKKGNCVDTAHLVIALTRAAGIPARYEHVYAKFTSGNWYGHVIAQVYVNGKWYYADASSNSNTFGVIKNWSTSSATIKGYYASLPF
ncbi:pseudomurein-binding repeat-containing protein [Methanobacterium oryzae]|uniref:pseudomurein-binding repeat-containing protein n=1 Tax=Methanobacterium oryzae TaxID=69540 RepID=UPI003D1CC9DA